jgi:DNA-binding transcriptional regulator YiaG
MSKARKRSPIVEEVIGDLTEYVDALDAGGRAEVERRFTVRRIKLVAGPPEVGAADVKAARESLGVSQALFAQFLGVSPQLVKGWERGARTPVGAARRLLADIRRHPDHWRKRVHEAISV